MNFQCLQCGRFVCVEEARADGREYVEYSDSGVVVSAEYECERCANPGYRCCGVEGGCGGPCATYPHFELVT